MDPGYDGASPQATSLRLSGAKLLSEKLRQICFVGFEQPINHRIRSCVRIAKRVSHKRRHKQIAISRNRRLGNQTLERLDCLNVSIDGRRKLADGQRLGPVGGNHGEAVSRPHDLDDAIGPQELEMARTIARELEQHFAVELDATEVSELALLLASRTTMLDYRTANRENIVRFVGEACLDVVNEMIEDLKENAGINLSEHELYVRFALHIKNLIVRARTGGLSKNPLTQQIKTSCPLLYDTAVVEADLLQRRAEIQINDDEIAYIAFHLGSTLETQKQLTNKVKAVLYCPSYYNIDAKILLFLNRHFEDDLLVTNVVTDEGDLAHLQGAELLISTVPVNSYYGAPTYLISIVPGETDRLQIRHMVDDIRAEKRRRALREHLENLIEPGLFEINSARLQSRDVIHTMAERLVERGYVTDEFEQQVLEREKLSSTVYGSCAIPHALRMASRRSSISIMLSRMPISWGNANVNLVIMLSFSKSDQEVFYEVFDPLVSVLSNREQVAALVKTETYDAFISRLCEMMG